MCIHFGDTLYMGEMRASLHSIVNPWVSLFSLVSLSFHVCKTENTDLIIYEGE